MSTRRPLLFAGLLALTAVPLMVSCNAISGADDLRLKTEDEDSEPGTGGPILPPIEGLGETGGKPVDKTVEAGGVSIASVALYQGVKRPLMEAGAKATSDIPIVAGRAALLRISVTTDATYNGQPVIGRVYFGSSTKPIEGQAVLAAESSDGDLATTINIDVPGESITVGATYRVELRQNSGASAPSGMIKYPASGAEALDVQSAGQTLKVVLVPVQYDADGSSRLPDTTPEQVQLYKDWFYGFYPIPAVEITVREPMAWPYSISPNGSGWEDLLIAVGDLRAEDAAASDVYYYGLFQAAASEGQFCSGGCVLGLANLTGPGESYLQAGIGLGYTGSTHTDTAVHEIGHTHGRQHSPCGGAAGADPAYPHPDAALGTWGYDLVSKKLIDPEVGKDVMGYCLPMWTSDYTYKAFFERLKLVNKAKVYTPPELMNRTYNRVRVGMDGSLHWLKPVTMERPPVGHETKSVVVATERGTQTITGEWYPYDHLDGGVLVWPQTESPAKSIQLTHNGALKTLAR